jgi:two-component system OmpR family response regulator
MSTSAAILIVEDDREIGTLVRDLLHREGFEARLARSGADVDESLKRDGLPDLVVLDLMLPGEDGLSICRRLQAAHARLPVLMLTAKREDIDRIIGLELGADDYLGKPFNPRELLARIRAILRRAAPVPLETAEERNEYLRFAGYTLDPATRRLARDGGEEVELHSGEFELLNTLVEHPQRVLTRDQLLDWTRGRNWEAFDRSIDVAISRLRRKIEPDPARPTLIKTVRNGGYLFTPAVERCKA